MARKSHKGDRASSSAVQCNKKQLSGVVPQRNGNWGVGVVPQRNGNWGVQIYANHKRIWLGTFKSEKEAALAYDRASIKLKGKDSPRNLPNEPVFETESYFQNHFTDKEVVEMIKHHSYDEKLLQMKRLPNLPRSTEQGEPLQQLLENLPGSSMMHKPHQFCKALTHSDVGSLNRLVIPKEHARSHLPIKMLDSGETIFLTFFDSGGEEWKFRLKYWTSSRSYVLTSGWRNFVKAKKLEAGDTVCFTPDSTTENTFYITIPRSHEDGKSNSSCIINGFPEKFLAMSTSTESHNSVPQEGRDPGAVTNMLTMPMDFSDSKPTELVRAQDCEGLQGNSIMNSADIHDLVGYELKTEKTETDNGSIKLFGVTIFPNSMPQGRDPGAVTVHASGFQ